MDFKKYRDAVCGEINRSLLELIPEQIECAVEQIASTERIFCDGMGRSGLQAETFVMRLAQMKREAYFVSGVATTAIRKEDLLIICSGSGETESLVQHAQKAKNIGTRMIAITTNAESAVAKLADEVIKIWAPNKQRYDKESVQPMGTLFEQTEGILFDIMVLMLMERLHITGEQMRANHKNLE